MTAPVESKFRTFREIWKFLIPGNFQTGDGELVQYTEGRILDAFAEACRQTALLMFPSVCPSDALVYLGRDRSIPRGFAEPEASYRARLIAWRYPRGHRVRGGAAGLLEQIFAVFGGVAAIDTIDARGTRYSYGDPTVITRGVTWDWDGETLLPNWARFWVVVGSVNARPWPSFDDGAWGPVVDNPDVCVDMQGVHPGQIAAVRRLTQVGNLSWTPAGRRPIYLVVQFEGELYPAPDGTWDEWENRPVGQYSFTPLHDSLE